jgi:hypothetical protein
MSMTRAIAAAATTATRPAIKFRIPTPSHDISFDAIPQFRFRDLTAEKP